LYPVDGVWDGTTEDITATIDTTELHGLYTIYVHGKDADGRWGAYDEEEFAVLYEWEVREVILQIETPQDGDEYTVTCDGKYVEVVVDARYKDDYNYDDIEDIGVQIWLDTPNGAPDIYYNEASSSLVPIPVEWNEIEERFIAYVDIYKYHNGTTLDLQAEAEDISGWNKAEDDATFKVYTAIDYDIWLSEGWNGPINLAVLGCDDSVESVFASIDADYEVIFEVGTWLNYHNGHAGNTLHFIDLEAWYWIKMNNVARFYIDNNCPEVTIEYPDDEETFYSECLEKDIWGYACDLETSVTEVTLVIYDDDTGLYWDGAGAAWVADETQLPCVYDDETKEWYYDGTADIDYIYISGHTIILTATATDMAGCSCSDTIWYMFIDDSDPYVEITYPVNEATYDDCLEPSEIYGIAYDDECETIVTEVYIQIQDEETGKWWDGDSWEDDPTNLVCYYDLGDEEWYYAGDIPEWEDQHWYYINAIAKDAAGNTNEDDIEFYYECAVGSISGTVYYYGEGEGNVTVLLFEAPLSGPGMPIDTYFMPIEQQGYPVIGPYEFTGLVDDTYFVAAIMDTNDNENYDEWEPMGFAVNKSTWPDDIEVSQSVETDKDVTLFDPDPSIGLEKYVWDDCEEEWVDETWIEYEDIARFNISIHNDGSAAPLYMDDLYDYLPDGLDYVEGSTEMWIVTPDETHYGTPEPTQTSYPGGTMLTWDLNNLNGDLTLFPCNWIYLEFEAEVTDCESEGLELVNEAEVISWYADFKVNDTDSATVWALCPCEPDIDVGKYVWCPIGEDWVDSIGVISGQTVRFNISIHNDGSGYCDLSEINVTDDMDPELSYTGDMTVVCDNGLTYTFEMTDDKLYWNFTGSLEPCQWIYIEFNATVDYVTECWTIYNWVDVDAYSEWTDEYVSGDSSAYLWDYYCD